MCIQIWYRTFHIFTTNYWFGSFIKVSRAHHQLADIFEWMSDILLFNDVSITKAAGLLAICMWCFSIRGLFGKWDQLLFSSIWILQSQKINGKIFTNPHWCVSSTTSLRTIIPLKASCLIMRLKGWCDPHLSYHCKTCRKSNWTPEYIEFLYLL